MDLILHHYDQSPYSEKIRLIFGLKNLAWKSVIVPMVLPKPSLIREHPVEPLWRIGRPAGYATDTA